MALGEAELNDEKDFLVTIKKFIAIENVGRFSKCSQKGPELKRHKLFFAENGRGKTTLCAVLRSLQSGHHEHITERQTLASAAGLPAATIRMESGEARFQKHAWNATLPDITIFDSTFIAQNVHAGEFVGRDHRTNLLQIIVGEAGVKLSDAVIAFDTQIRDKNSDITRVRRTLEALLTGGTKLDAFLALAEDTGIAAKLDGKREALKTAKQADTLINRAGLSELNAPAAPATLLGVLGKTLAGVSADAEARLKEHIATHDMHNRGERWLAAGVGFIKDEACPFCAQSLKGVALIGAYKQYFSDAYSALMEEIGGLDATLNGALGDASLTTVAMTLGSNEGAVEFWNPYVAVTLPPLEFDGFIRACVVALRTAAEALIAQKKGDPMSAVVPDLTYKQALAAFEKVPEAVAAYNKAVRASNDSIAAKKKEAVGASVSALEKDLADLLLMQQRHDAKVKPICAEFLTHVADKAALDAGKAQAKESLDGHADQMITDYEATINKLLIGFGAGFTITNSKKTYVGGTATSAYQLLINDHAIDLGDGTTPIGTPCFRTTLSAGDKSTLALAFFLTKLEHDPNKANRIIIFDDPFNSQDRSRRERTAELLKKYGIECKQLLLLSHDPQFLLLVHDKFLNADRHTMQLSRVYGNFTTIEEWDIVAETKAGYFKDHAALTSYLLNGTKDLLDMVRKIRPVLEGYMRYRFPNQFPPDKWLGDMISHVRTVGAAHPMHQALAELEGINDYSKKYHCTISSVGDHPVSSVEDQGCT